MNATKILKSILIFTFILAAAYWSQLDAQCPMCRMAAETNLANGGTEGKGLNKGILYMLAMPYILVSTVGFIWWRNNKKMKEEEEASDVSSVTLDY